MQIIRRLLTLPGGVKPANTPETQANLPNGVKCGHKEAGNALWSSNMKQQKGERKRFYTNYNTRREQKMLVLHQCKMSLNINTGYVCLV